MQFWINESYSSSLDGSGLPTFSGTAAGGRVLLLVTQYGHRRGPRAADTPSPGTDGASTAVVRGMVWLVCVDTWGQGRGGRRRLLLMLQGPLNIELQDNTT